MAASEWTVLPNGWCNASPLLPLLGLIHKKPSSCRDWDWVCVRIFWDRSKTTETKRSAQTPARPLSPLGSLQGPLQGSWSFTQARSGLPGHFSEQLACLGGSNTNTDTYHIIKGTPICWHTFHLFFPCHFIKKKFEKVLSKTGAAGLLQIDKLC